MLHKLDMLTVSDADQHNATLQFDFIEWIVVCDLPPRRAAPPESKQPMNMGLITAAKKKGEDLEGRL